MEKLFMNIAGIDYSLCAPAICLFIGDYYEEFSFNNCMFHFLTDTNKYAKSFGSNIVGQSFDIFESDPERYDSISDWVMEKLGPIDEISLEGYAFGSKSNRLFQIAEHTGVLKYKIYQNSIPLSVFTPSEVKKFATGKGNANKKDMYDAFVKETKVKLKEKISPKKKDIGNPVSDIVDSYYICKLLYSKLKVKSF